MSAELVTPLASHELGEDTFTDFYRSEHEQQVRRAYLMVGDEAIAHDVVAEAFTAVFKRWSDIAEPGPYLHRCVVNGCNDVHRRGRRHELAADMEVVVGEVGAHDAAGTSVGEADAMAELLLELPFRQRAAVVLRFYGGQSEAEIATTLECRPGTVGSLIHRALKTLRTTLDGEA